MLRMSGDEHCYALSAENALNAPTLQQAVLLLCSSRPIPFIRLVQPIAFAPRHHPLVLITFTQLVTAIFGLYSATVAILSANARILHNRLRPKLYLE